MADCPLAAVLTGAAARLGEPGLARLAAGLTAPVRVRVRGGPDAIRVLRAAGVMVCGPAEEPDLEVLVVTGTPRPGDGRPDRAVLDEGFGTVAMSVTAAVAAFGGAIEDDDLSAIADAVGVVSRGADRTAVRAALRRASGVDEVRAAIDRAGAPIRYRRVEAALDELAGRALGPDGARLAVFLAGDDVVLSRMLAAAEVMRAAGMAVPSVPADPLAAAIRWRRYSDGPVSVLHRACAADLSRGALRLWDRRSPAARPATTGPVTVGRAGLHQSRIEAGAAVRAGCAALRAELQAGVQELTRAEDFLGQARQRVAGLAADVEADVEARLTTLAGTSVRPDPAALPEEPPVRAAALETRLAALLGLTFGAGAALTVGRTLADLLPRWALTVSTGCALLGLAVGLWVFRARRLLSERAAADRWVLEATLGLRSALEDHVAARFAAAEVTLLTSAPFGGSGRQ